MQNYKNSHKDINMDISSLRLKEFRKSNKLTQDKLATKLKISRSIIAFHENKRTTMGTPFLFELCKKYNISADYLLGKIDTPKELS
jgi:repressor LexA